MAQQQQVTYLDEDTGEPIYLDDNGNPVGQATSTPEFRPDESFLDRTGRIFKEEVVAPLTTPIEAPSRFAESVKNFIGTSEHPHARVARGAVDLLFPQTPLDFLAEAVGGPAIPTAVRTGSRAISRGADILRGVEKAAPVVKPGAAQVAETIVSEAPPLVHPDPFVKIKPKSKPGITTPKSNIQRDISFEDTLEQVSRPGTSGKGFTPSNIAEAELKRRAFIESIDRALGKKVIPETAARKAAPPTPPEPPIKSGGGNIPPGGGDSGLPLVDVKKQSALSELYNMPRAIMASTDLSAPFRQGLPLIHRKEWWQAWDDMVMSAGSEKAFRGVMDGILEKPMFKAGVDANGKHIPSFAEKAGLKLTDLVSDITKREENFVSTWAETGGNLPYFSTAYRNTFGRVVRGSNRAYVAFLNKLRADTFENMMATMRKTGLDPDKDEKVARDLAAFINDATGRGSLGKLEKVAPELNNVIFSPRLISSRLSYMNPKNYVSSSIDKQVRKERLKSVLAMGGTWLGMGSIGAMGGADVSLNPTSSDFGKIRVGNTRLDPAAGFQQYLVAMARFMSGYNTQATTFRNPNPTMEELGTEYGGKTRLDVVQDFAANKTHPVVKFAYDWANASKYRPFDPADRTMELFIPMFVQDVYELMQEDPLLLPMAVPAGLGMSTQTFGGPQEQ